MNSKINLAIFFGGKSVEHEISILSALQAIAAIDGRKYNIIPIYISKKGPWYTGNQLTNVENYKDIPILLSKSTKIYLTAQANDPFIYTNAAQKIQSIDIALPIMHGSPGEDGSLQGLFELKEIAYCGSNVIASAIGMDKILTKMVLSQSHISTPNFTWFYAYDWFRKQEHFLSKIQSLLGLPVVIKPSNLGSSVGVKLASTRKELKEAINYASDFADRILVEEAIPHLEEINCSIRGDHRNLELSVLEKPIRAEKILSYKDKYMSQNENQKLKIKPTNSDLKEQGMSSLKREIPAMLPIEVEKNVLQLSSKTYKAIDCSGLVRIDFLWNQSNNKIYVNEINSIPGSLSFYLWEPKDISFTKLLDEMIGLGLWQHQNKNKKVRSYDQNIFALGGQKHGKI